MSTFSSDVLLYLLGDSWTGPGESWHGLGQWHEKRDDGVWVRPLDDFDAWSMTAAEKLIRLAHPTNQPENPALPFPFTVEQFVAFAKTAPLSGLAKWPSAPQADMDNLQIKSRGAHRLALALRGERTPDEDLDPPKRESREERQRRRYDEFESAGGRAVLKHGKWKLAGERGVLANLARRESERGTPYRNVRDVSKDIKAEAERRRAGRALSID